MMRNLLLVISLFTGSVVYAQYKDFTKAELKNKVEGAWAAKMIGVMYGREMEFKALGRTYDKPINWYPELIEKALLEDDLYGQLSFMETIEKYNNNATVKQLAHDFAYASFPLCHANLQARKNIFDGIMPPLSGAPQYSMHSDDIDFQIESDFIGFIHPGLTQSAINMCDSVGRIMAYGDGLYGGMFVSAMHSIAYYENDTKKIVRAALKAIPSKSTYAQCIQDVLKSYDKHPHDWKKTWQLIQDKWAANDICIPFHEFNIDAKLNGAYIAIALLYGNNDLEKTMEIAVRCGQDTDCNAANAAAVLGIILGLDNIPTKFKSHLPHIADKNFLHTNYTYNKAVKQTLTLIERNILANGGKVQEDKIRVRIQTPKFKGKYEQAYPDKVMSYQVEMKDRDKWTLKGQWKEFVYGNGDNDLYMMATSPNDRLELEFEGSGISLLGSWNTSGGKADIYIDDKFVKTIDVYFREEAGKYDVNRAHIFHDMNLQPGKHKLTLIVSSQRHPQSTGHNIWIQRAVIYKNN